MDQFLTGDIWGKVNTMLKEGEKKTACTAYITLDKLELTEGDTLVCNASRNEIESGKTSAKVIETYFNRGVKVYTNQNLHSKILHTDSFLVIGSANLSNNSAERLIESSIVTDNSTLISQSKAFCFNLIEASNLLTREGIDSLLKIKVEERSFKPPIETKVRNKTFGNSTWVISLSELSDKIAEKEEEFVEKAKKHLQNENVTYIRMTGESKFCDTAKEGDQFFHIWAEKDKKRKYFHSLNTILLVEKDVECTRFYYDDNRTDENRIPFSKLEKTQKKLNLDKKICKLSMRKVTDNDVQKLKALFQKK